MTSKKPILHFQSSRAKSAKGREAVAAKPGDPQSITPPRPITTTIMINSSQWWAQQSARYLAGAQTDPDASVRAQALKAAAACSLNTQLAKAREQGGAQ